MDYPSQRRHDITEYALIPQPVPVKYTEGTFQCPGIPRVAPDGGDFEGEVRVFNAQIAKTFGEAAFAEGSGGIRLAKSKDVASEESYRAVQIAAALGVSVECLVNGKEFKQQMDISRYVQFKDILDDLAILPTRVLTPIKAVIKSFAESERKTAPPD